MVPLCTEMTCQSPPGRDQGSSRNQHFWDEEKPRDTVGEGMGLTSQALPRPVRGG